MARGVGIEPTTISLTASRSAAELPPNEFLESMGSKDHRNDSRAGDPVQYAIFTSFLSEFVSESIINLSMKIFLSVVGSVVLATALLIVGWFIYQRLLLTQAPTPTTETLTIQKENTEEGTAQEDTTQTTIETIPELNPIEKTNPFSGSYKNPFKK